jgi:hypothetical protein
MRSQTVPVASFRKLLKLSLKRCYGSGFQLASVGNLKSSTDQGSFILGKDEDELSCFWHIFDEENKDMASFEL